jgi:tubulin-folding cofactor B
VSEEGGVSPSSAANACRTSEVSFQFPTVRPLFIITITIMSTTASGINPNIRNKDLLALRAYITGNDATQFENVHESTVVLDLTHSNLLQRHIEIRFGKHDTLERLRQRIHQKSGTAPQFQHLQIKSASQIIREIPPEFDDHYPLGYFGLEHHGLEVHCVDLNPLSGSSGGQYENVSLVKKYKMTEEEYSKRKGTLRDWGREQKAKDSTFTLAKHARHHRELCEAQRQHKLGLALPKGFFLDSTGKIVRDDPEEEVAVAIPEEEEASTNELYSKESVAGMEVGNRCQVEPGARRGIVSFLGEVPELGSGGGYWVGVTFDEPVGKTDGTAKGGKRYFEVLPKHGGFARGKNVQVGDFPERDIFDDSDEDEL